MSALQWAGANFRMSSIFGAKERSSAIALGGLIALKLAILFVFAWHHRFVMDEFAQLGWAKYVGHGFFDTVWPSKAVGFQIFIGLSHLVGWDARSILLVGRMEMALLACATLAVVYAIARSLSQSRTRAALILLVLLSFSNFIERIFETRAEPLAVFFAAAALLVAIRAEDRSLRIAGAGVLSGLAFLSTQKSIYFNVALGLALVLDAGLARHYAGAAKRGLWLVVGWALAVIAYCLIFGGSDPIPIAKNLIFGPAGVASSHTAAEYGGLRGYVVKTLSQNALLYLFCFAGMIVAFVRIRRLDGPARIALIFSVAITVLVFAHNQPWPYVFVMALPFMSLWALEPLDVLLAKRPFLAAASIVLGIAVAASFVRNVDYLGITNVAQLHVATRVESLIGPNETYFDGIGMLPDRPEPATLWLDRHYVLKTVREGENSEAFRIFRDAPPKIIIWSYRMDAIYPVVRPLIDKRYVKVAPNIRMAGRRLVRGETGQFDARVAGIYALYTDRGEPLTGVVDVDGRSLSGPIEIAAGAHRITLEKGPRSALLLPRGSYGGKIAPGPDNEQLFAGVYS